MDYSKMSKEKLLKKLEEYSLAFDSGQIDFWFLEQIAIIQKELESRE